MKDERKYAIWTELYDYMINSASFFQNNEQEKVINEVDEMLQKLWSDGGVK